MMNDCMRKSYSKLHLWFLMTNRIGKACLWFWLHTKLICKRCHRAQCHLLPVFMGRAGTVSWKERLRADVHIRRSALPAAWTLMRAAVDDSTHGTQTLGLAMSVVVLLLVEIRATIYYSYVQQKFMTGLLEKNIEAFYAGLYETGILILCICPVIGLHECANWLLSTSSRTSLTRSFVKSYLASPGVETCPFYTLTITGEIDNPDQRICQDIEDFVNGVVYLSQDLIRSILSICGFTFIMYSISPAACVGAVIYSIIGTQMSLAYFGQVISFWREQRLRQEADLRAHLIRVRENAESVAFFHGGEAEWTRFDAAFSSLLQTIRKSIWIGTGFSIYNRGFHWATFAVVPLLVGPTFLRGDAPAGVIAQATTAFDVILGSMTVIMDKLYAFSDLGVRTRRLEVLLDALRRAQEKALLQQRGKSVGASSIASRDLPEGGHVLLQFSGVTLKTPLHAELGQRTLCQHVSFELLSGKSLLIIGESGIGKSSLLRAAAGLWADGSGTISSCMKHVFFVPQKPYMFPGSLREQLLYPCSEQDTELSDDDLRHVLQQVNLVQLLQQYDLSDRKDWSSLLSLGQQQRINFARLRLRPSLRLALIDEGTSACDLQNEALLYQNLKENLCSYVSVGHRPSLQNYHTHVLWLRSSPTSDGSFHCTLLPMSECRSAFQGESCTT